MPGSGIVVLDAARRQQGKPATGGPSVVVVLLVFLALCLAGCYWINRRLR